jgi:PIN domain nuclease of toxin-antitoxin system
MQSGAEASAVSAGPGLKVLIDASALIALLGAEPGAAEVKDLLDRGGAGMTALNLAEAVDRLQRRYGLGVEQTRPVIEGLLTEALELVPLDPVRAWRAGEIRASHYHRTSCPLSLADAVFLASVPAGAKLASSDTDVLAVAVEEGLAILPLLDSQGRRPSV